MTLKRRKHLVEMIFKMSTYLQEYKSQVYIHLDLVRRRYPSLPITFFQELAKEYTVDKLLDQVYQVFAENFTDEELNQIISFWASGVGRKMVSKNFIEAQQRIGFQWATGMERKCLDASQGTDEELQEDHRKSEA